MFVEWKLTKSRQESRVCPSDVAWLHVRALRGGARAAWSPQSVKYILRNILVLVTSSPLSTIQSLWWFVAVNALHEYMTVANELEEPCVAQPSGEHDVAAVLEALVE